MACSNRSLTILSRGQTSYLYGLNEPDLISVIIRPFPTQNTSSQLVIGAEGS